MLTWDEEAKPSLQKSLTSGLPEGRVMDLLPLSLQTQAAPRKLDDAALTATDARPAAAVYLTLALIASTSAVVSSPTVVTLPSTICHSRNGPAISPY